MPIWFKCPSCSKVLSAPDERGGDTARCPGCGQLMQVPERPAVQAEAETALRLGGQAPAPSPPERPAPTPKVHRNASASRKPARPARRSSGASFVIPAVVLVALMAVAGVLLWPHLRRKPQQVAPPAAPAAQAKTAAVEPKAPDSSKAAPVVPPPETSTAVATKPKPKAKPKPSPKSSAMATKTEPAVEVPLNPTPPKPLPELDFPTARALTIVQARATLSADGTLQVALKLAPPDPAAGEPAVPERIVVFFFTRFADMEAPVADASATEAAGPKGVVAVFRRALEGKDKAAVDFTTRKVSGEVSGGVRIFDLDQGPSRAFLIAGSLNSGDETQAVAPADILPRSFAVLVCGKKPAGQGSGALSNIFWAPVQLKQ